MRWPATTTAFLAATMPVWVTVAAGGSAADPQVSVVTGTVVSAQADGGAVRLAFDDDPRSLRIVLVAGWLSNFPPDAARYYVGKSVTVRGRITTFRGGPEITIRDAADVSVIGGAAAATPGPVALPNEIDTLRAHIRSLEQRVHELEQQRPAEVR